MKESNNPCGLRRNNTNDVATKQRRAWKYFRTLAWQFSFGLIYKHKKCAQQPKSVQKHQISSGISRSVVLDRGAAEHKGAVK